MYSFNENISACKVLTTFPSTILSVCLPHVRCVYYRNTLSSRWRHSRQVLSYIWEVLCLHALSNCWTGSTTQVWDFPKVASLWCVRVYVKMSRLTITNFQVICPVVILAGNTDALYQMSQWEKLGWFIKCSYLLATLLQRDTVKVKMFTLILHWSHKSENFHIQKRQIITSYCNEL